MSDLMKIFGPIAQWNEALRDIQAIGIDVIGTAIDHQGRMHREIIDMMSFLSRTNLDLMLQFISTQPKEGEEALHLAGVRHPALKNGVITKEVFYKQAREKGQHVVAFDDSPAQAAKADVHIDPKDKAVDAYFHEHGYRHPERYQPK